MTVLHLRTDLYAYDGQSLMVAPEPGISVPERVEAIVGRGQHLTGTYGRDSVAWGGSSYGQRTQDAARRVDRHLRRTVGTKYIFDGGCQTDLILGAQAASLIVTMEAYWSARKAAGWDFLIASTVPDMNSAYQTPAIETQRQAINELIRSSTVPDAVADIAAVPELGPSGASQNASYFFDGLHYTNAATLLAGEVFAAALPN